MGSASSSSSDTSTAAADCSLGAAVGAAPGLNRGAGDSSIKQLRLPPTSCVDDERLLRAGVDKLSMSRRSSAMSVRCSRRWDAAAGWAGRRLGGAAPITSTPSESSSCSVSGVAGRRALLVPRRRPRSSTPEATRVGGSGGPPGGPPEPVYAPPSKPQSAIAAGAYSAVFKQPMVSLCIKLMVKSGTVTSYNNRNRTV